MSDIKLVSLTNNELIAAMNSLSEIALLRLPPRAAFKLKTTIAEASRQNEAYESVRAGIVEEFCVRDDDGNMVMADTERGAVRMKPGFAKPLSELGEQTGVAIPAISATMLIGAAEEAQVKLSPGVLSGLGKLLIDDFS